MNKHTSFKIIQISFKASNVNALISFKLAVTTYRCNEEFYQGIDVYKVSYLLNKMPP